MAGFVKIDNRCFSELGLDPTEALVYSLVYNVNATSGKAYNCTIGQLSEYYHIPERTLFRVISRLEAANLIEKKRNRYGLSFQICQNDISQICQNATSQIPQFGSSDMPNCTFQICQNDISHNLKNNIQEYLKNNNPLPPLQKLTDNEIILYGIKSFFEAKGMMYIPDYRLLTTATNEIVPKLRAAYGKDADMAECWRKFLNKAWDVADNWEKQNFDLPLLSSRFTKFINGKKSVLPQQLQVNKHEGPARCSFDVSILNKKENENEKQA